MKALLQKIRKLLKDRRFRNTWHRSVSVFAAVVVFITTYALVLPAITLEKTADCGIEEHQHDESCYEYRLICGQEESEGHHHDDCCFTVTKESVCDLQEHQHSEENGCYDEEGNLVCEIQEHVHDESCFQDVETLTCGQEESEGHHHTDACYEKVLVCGKEVHTHSAECYKEDNSAAAAEEAAGGSSTVVSEEQGSSGSDEMPEESVGKETAGMTGATEEAAAAEPFVPQLDPLNMDAMMTKDTGIYYFHAEEGEDIPSNSAGITDWQKVKGDTKLAPTDLVKVYLAYKIPAGSLNETNPAARYRLPGNIHLTDDQIDAINHTRNGVYASMEGDEAGKYLGAEAVEGDRKPDEELRDGAQEYISAVVRAENVYDGNGQYLGQDLIFTFVPYTVEKNQNTYDADGNQLTAGEKVTGWFACDFNMSQIDWVEQEADPDNNTAEKTAELVFVEKDGGIGTKEISTVLTLVETDDDGNSEADPESASAEETAEDASAEEEASSADKDDTASDAGETDTVEYQSGTLTAEGDGYRITLDYTEEAKIPENAELSVKEITPETDKEAYEACLEQAKKQVTGDNKSTVDETASRFFDIEIVVRNTGDDGSEKVQKIEPAAPVSVNIQITDTSRNADSASGSGKTEQSDPTVLHFAEEGVEQIDSTVKAGSEQEKGEGQNTEVQFEAESFSVYGVVYTVDFHWEVDGKEYEYSLAGGDTISFRELAGILGVVSGDSQDSNNDNVTEGTSDAAEEENSAKDSENSSAGAEETAEFIDGVSEIRFSNESLVKVARITDEITAGGTVTAGALKERLGLECEYSAELTEIQREAMDSKEFRAPDWVLISLKAFDTEEYLTVEMKNGESFRIKVTDAKISKNILTADGENFVITIVYTDDAEIPSDADLNVAEILPSSEDYKKYVDESAGKLNVDGQDIAYARFFDIEIVRNGEKIEPKAPVQVIISHKDALDVSLGDTLT